jgi:hypothetical protein
MNETGQTQQKGNLNAPLGNLNVPPPRPHRNLPELSQTRQHPRDEALSLRGLRRHRRRHRQAVSGRRLQRRRVDDGMRRLVRVGDHRSLRTP